MVNEIMPDFLCDFVNEQLNSDDAPFQWEHCTVIPLYKANKMGDVEDPSSFRAVVLQESTMKFVESVWVHCTRADVEREIGINHA